MFMLALYFKTVSTGLTFNIVMQKSHQMLSILLVKDCFVFHMGYDCEDKYTAL